MAWGSTTPVVIEALVTALRGAPELTGVKVYDGPTLSGSSAKEALNVGTSPSPDVDAATSAEGQESREGLAVDRTREQYTIHCGVSVLNGSSNAPAARRRVFELLAAVGAALAADPTLGRTVLQVQIGTWTLAQQQGQTGAVATIAFGIDVDAFTR